MKVGIISINMYSKGLNFACPLHTYAFQQFLLQNNIDATVIDYKPIYYDDFDLRHPADYYAKKCEAYTSKSALSEKELALTNTKLSEHIKKRDAWKKMYRERELRYDKFQHFIDTHYIKTDFCYDSDFIELIDPGFDCYICATDVIWKNQPNLGFDRGFFLASSTMENKWKIAYSASRGVYFANNKEEDSLFFHYLDDIDYISVREASLKSYIEQNTDQPVTQVLDPVLLHDKDFYEEIAVTPPEQDYILLYFVMEKATDTIQQAIRYARAKHLKIVEITDSPYNKYRRELYEAAPDVEVIQHYTIGIEEWLGYFLHAKHVFTNSFHACCFCILFQKDFFVGFRHGDKVQNVLETFGLTDRRINMDTDLMKNPPKAIDFNHVYTILKKKRKESSDFLLSAIHAIENKAKPIKDYEAYKKSLKYPVLYNSQKKSKNITWTYSAEQGITQRLASGSVEYTPASADYSNTGNSRFQKNEFQYKHHHFCGWKIRIKIDNRWFWYLENGTLKYKNDYKAINDPPIQIFKDESFIPYIPVNRISTIVAEAVWKEYLPYKVYRKFKTLIKKHLF